MTRNTQLHNMLFFANFKMPCHVMFLSSGREHCRSLHPEMHLAQVMPHNDTMDLVVVYHTIARAHMIAT